RQRQSNRAHRAGSKRPAIPSEKTSRNRHRLRVSLKWWAYIRSLWRASLDVTMVVQWGNTCANYGLTRPARNSRIQKLRSARSPQIQDSMTRVILLTPSDATQE